MVKGRYKFCLLILIFVLTPLMAFAESDQSLELRYLKNRYRDFYIHETEQKRLQEKRLSGIQSQREYRKKLEAQRKAARLAYKKNRAKRVIRVDRSELEKKYETQKELQRKKREKLRAKFVMEQKKLKMMREQAKRIPEKKEVGLE